MIGTCEQCLREDMKLDRHHKDKNRRNNHPSNIAVLCRWCHREADGCQGTRPYGLPAVKRAFARCFPRA